MKTPLALLAVLTSPFAHSDEVMHHCPSQAEPLLTVADFNGDGIVTGRDVAMIRQAINRGEYLAFFDRNADRQLDLADQHLTVDDMQESSTLLDQQIAAVFAVTEKYRALSVAQADGFRNFTQDAAGHGAHYARLPFILDEHGVMDTTYENIMDDQVEITTPEGLTYDTDGNLAAVFYYHGYNVKELYLAASTGDQDAIDSIIQSGLMMGYLMRDAYIDEEAFDGDADIWHSHIGVCWDGLDYIAMQTPNTVHPYFNQHMTPAQCAASVAPSSSFVWNPSFNMLHLWLYNLNPCGKFAGLNPHVSPTADPEPFYQPLADWAAQMDLPLIEGNHAGGHGGH